LLILLVIEVQDLLVALEVGYDPSNIIRIFTSLLDTYNISFDVKDVRYGIFIVPMVICNVHFSAILEK